MRLIVLNLPLPCSSEAVRDAWPRLSTSRREPQARDSARTLHVTGLHLCDVVATNPVANTRRRTCSSRNSGLGLLRCLIGVGSATEREVWREEAGQSGMSKEAARLS